VPASPDGPHDIVVLGGGPGGYAAALYAASAGLDVALVEGNRVGGTCLHVGCIPAKALLETAASLRHVREAAQFGVLVGGEAAVDIPAMLNRKQGIIERQTKGLEGLLKHRTVTVHAGWGTLVAPDTVRVTPGPEGDGPYDVHGATVILSTGSSPRSLPGWDFDGHQVLSSDHVLSNDRIPARVVVIGGGAIGCEFASFYADMGAQVTILEALPQILTGVDVDAANVVVRAFRKRGITTRTSVKVLGRTDVGGAVGVRIDVGQGEEVVEADAVVVSVGRRPRSEDVGFEQVGVEVDERGFVKVDPLLRTTVAGVYALGDLVATPQLAHVAFAEAIIAVKDILGEDPAPLEYGKVPWGIYCHPEVAFCGLTEAQAREKGLDVEVSMHQFTPNGRAQIIGDNQGIVKIVAERNGPIVGVHLAGPWATELLHEGYLAVNWEATAADIGLLIHAHPTLGEVFGETALSLTGRSLHG
jgi:dihydrolipoamide dehydrogenase